MPLAAKKPSRCKVCGRDCCPPTAGRGAGMNWFGFVALMQEILGARLPRLERIEQRGLLAVKIAQTFALRGDLLEIAHCAQLARLYRRAQAVPAEDVELLLQAYTSAAWRSQFRRIETEPLASASVGQVHRAQLLDGREVVVKILKRQVRQEFVADVRRLRHLLQAAQALPAVTAYVGEPLTALQQIADCTLRELNLLNELRFAGILADLQGRSQCEWDLSLLRFPQAYAELCNENVLVTAYIPGKTLDVLLLAGCLPREVLHALVRLQLFFMFVPGIFHGDLHPGNIILQQGRFYFVDTGAVCMVGDKVRQGFLTLLRALSCGAATEGAAAVQEMLRPRLSRQAYASFAERFAALHRRARESGHLTNAILETLHLGMECGWRVGQGVFCLVKGLMHLEGIVNYGQTVPRLPALLPDVLAALWPLAFKNVRARGAK